MSLKLTEELYNEIVSIAWKYMLPCKIVSIFYDRRWSPEWIIDDVKNNPDNKSLDQYKCDSCYYYIMEEMEYHVNTDINSIHICDSFDLGDDDAISGDYLFHIGKLNNEVPYLFMESSHMYSYPNRLILYGPLYQIEINEDRVAINVYKTIKQVRNNFMISDEKEKVLAVMDLLKHSDRPRINI